jgi:diaminopimelate decarboxylase
MCVGWRERGACGRSSLTPARSRAAELLLRIRINDAHSAVPLGKKFGAELKDCERLIKLARKLGLKLVGGTLAPRPRSSA